YGLMCSATAALLRLAAHRSRIVRLPEQVLDGLVRELCMVVQVAALEGRLAAFEIPERLSPLQPVDIMDHRNHLPGAIRGVGNTAVPESKIADERAPLSRVASHG